jgi:lysophospholipase L1-like esterase
VRRQTSGDVLPRWRSECQQRLPDGCDNRIVVSFGVNDTASEGATTRVPAAASVENLTTLLRGARRSGWPALVVGPPPVADPVHDDRIAILDSAFSSACIAANVPYVATLAPLLATPVWMDEVRAGDGSHPGAAGYDALHRLVRPTWSDWIS